MVVAGIGLGLSAAFCQSLSYLATRHFVHPRAGGSRMLLVLAHVLMGAASAAVLPLLWPVQAPPWRQIVDPLVQTALFYLVGQIGLMVALRYAEPSRISPMLAFKLVVLAGLTVLLSSTPISPLQWLAIGLCLLGTISLNYSGGSTHPAASIALVLTCLAYALSDWNVGRLVHSVTGMELWRAFIWSTLLCYALCGLIALLFLPWLGSSRPRDWLDAAPFAGTWLLAMFFLFACFGMVGVVYGNILQSTRGLMSVLIGSLLARQGIVHLDTPTPRHVFVRRLLVAGLMILAVVLYAVGKDRPASYTEVQSTSHDPVSGSPGRGLARNNL